LQVDLIKKVIFKVFALLLVKFMKLQSNSTLLAPLIIK